MSEYEDESFESGINKPIGIEDLHEDQGHDGVQDGDVESEPLQRPTTESIISESKRSFL